jgi:hypothetical protein
MSKRQPPNPPDDPNRPNTKRTGERSEAAFLYQASQRRFAICKPWGDSERYDFILDNRPQPQVHLFRVQIKCTSRSKCIGISARYFSARTRARSSDSGDILARNSRKFCATFIHRPGNVLPRVTAGPSNIPVSACCEQPPQSSLVRDRQGK